MREINSRKIDCGTNLYRLLDFAADQGRADVSSFVGVAFFDEISEDCQANSRDFLLFRLAKDITDGNHDLFFEKIICARKTDQPKTAYNLHKKRH